MNKNSLYLDIATMLFRQDWTQLISRKKGIALLKQLKDRIKDTTKMIILDFFLATEIDKSFCDEFLTPLLKEYHKNITIIGVNVRESDFKVGKDDYERKNFEDINIWLERQGLYFLGIDVNNHPHLFGTQNPIINLILELFWSLKRITKEEIYSRLDQKSEDIDNALVFLLTTNYIKLNTTDQYGYAYYQAEYVRKIITYIGKTPKRVIESRIGDICENGHFELPSGVHIKKLYHISYLMKEPRLIQYLSAYFVDLLTNGVSFILTIETPNNIILAHRIAQLMGGARSIFAKLSKYGNQLELHEGFTIEKGETGIIAIDVVVSGLTVSLLLKLLGQKQGVLRGICSIINHTGNRSMFLPNNYQSLIYLNEPYYQKVNCPLCKLGEKPQKPDIMPGDWKW